MCQAEEKEKAEDVTLLEQVHLNNSTIHCPLNQEQWNDSTVRQTHNRNMPTYSFVLLLSHSCRKVRKVQTYIFLSEREKRKNSAKSDGFTWTSWFLSPGSITLTGDASSTSTMAAVGHLGTWVVGAVVSGSYGEGDTSWFWTYTWWNQTCMCFPQMSEMKLGTKEPTICTKLAGIWQSEFSNSNICVELVTWVLAWSTPNRNFFNSCVCQEYWHSTQWTYFFVTNLDHDIEGNSSFHQQHIWEHLLRTTWQFPVAPHVSTSRGSCSPTYLWLLSYWGAATVGFGAGWRRHLDVEPSICCGISLLFESKEGDQEFLAWLQWYDCCPGRTVPDSLVQRALLIV